MKNSIKALGAGLVLTLSSSVFAAESYVIDTKGMHAFVEFKIKHLGYSWLKGRFNDFEGEFNYDEKNPEKSKIWGKNQDYLHLNVDSFGDVLGGKRLVRETATKLIKTYTIRRPNMSLCGVTYT